MTVKNREVTTTGFGFNVLGAPLGSRNPFSSNLLSDGGNARPSLGGSRLQLLVARRLGSRFQNVNPESSRGSKRVEITLQTSAAVGGPALRGGVFFMFDFFSSEIE